MKLLIKISAGIISLLAIAVVSVQFWLKSAPEGIDAIEDALATSDLAFIGMIDHQKIRSIMDALQEAQDPMPIPVPGVEQDLIDKLFSGRANLAQNLQQTLGAIHVHPDLGLNFSFFLLGEIDPSAVQPTMSEYFDISGSGQGRFAMLRKETPRSATASGGEDNFECPGDTQTSTASAARQPIYAQYFEQGLLITLDEAYLDKFAARLGAGYPVEADLADWDDYKKGKLVSFIAKRPHESVSAAPGFGGRILKDISEDNAEITKIAGSAAVDLISLKLELDLTSHASSSWAEENAAAGNQKLAEYVDRADEFSATLARMINNASLHSENDALVARLSLPFNLVSNIQDVFDEVMASVFSVGSSGKKGEVVEEQILENPWDYGEQAKLATLVDMPREDSFFRPNYQQGPFGFSLETAELDQGVLSLAVSAKAQFAKLEKGRRAKGYEATFNVVSVRDKNGNELLRDERCIELEPRYTIKNHKPDSGFIGENRYQFNKKVRLIESARLSDIDRIALRMEMTVKTDIEFFEVPALPGQKIEFQGTRLFVSKVEGSSVNYRLSGNKDALLELRALNRDKRPLRSSGGFGFGVVKSKEFKGEIKFLQAFFAASKREVKQNFEFGFDQLVRRAEVESVVLPALIPKLVSKGFFLKSPAIKDKNLKTEKSSFVWGDVKDEHRRGTLSTGPVRLELYHNHEDQWSFNPMLRVYYPFTDELVTNLNGIQLTVRDKSGAEHIHYDEFYVGRATQGGESWLIPRYSLGKRKYEARDIELDGLDLKVEDQLDVLEGEVVFRLPTKIVESRFEMPRIGESIELGNSRLTLTKVSFGGIPRIRFSIDGDFHNILNIVALNDKNEKIRYAQIFRNKNDLGIGFDNRADIRAFVVYSAAALENVSYPFRIVPRY